MWLVLQAGPAPMPGWVGPTVAISLAIVAVAFIVIALVTIVTARGLRDASQSVGDSVERLERDAAPVLQAAREVLQDGQEISGMVRKEAKSLVKTSKRLRRRVRDGAARVEERLEDLDALYEVVYEEVEDTALGVAASLRTARRARRLLSPLSRLWRGRR